MAKGTGRTTVVTGAASGIGLATCRRLLADGGTIVGADLADPPDDLVGAERCTFVTADVADEASVEQLVSSAPGRLAGLVHAAGVAGGGMAHDLAIDEWARVIA